MIRLFLSESVQFSHSVMSDSLLPYGLQHTRPPYSSPAPRLYSDSCPLSRWCHPTISSCCPFLIPTSIFSSIMVFSNASFLHLRWPKYLSFSFSISPSNKHSGLISFRMDWFDLLTVQGTLKSLLKHHNTKTSLLLCSAFFIVQLSHPYMAIGKTIALTRWSFVGKVISLLFNMLSRLVITFLPRSKCLLISWLQSPSAVILEPQIIKSVTVSTLSHLFPMKWWDQLPWCSFSECWVLSQLFPSPLSLSSRRSLDLSLLSTHKGSVICISEVIDISPGSLDSSLCFIQPSISHDVLCI